MNTPTQLASILSTVDFDREAAIDESIYRSSYVGTEEFTVDSSDDIELQDQAVREVKKYLATMAGHNIVNEFAGSGEWSMMAEDDFACEIRDDEIEAILNRYSDEAQDLVNRGAMFVVLVNYKGEEEGIGYAPACKRLQKFIGKYNYR